MGLGNGNREIKKSHCFIVSNVTHHELNNLTGEKQFREKEITTEKEMILLMRWKHVFFFGTRSRFLPIGLNTFFSSYEREYMFSKRLFWSIYFKAQVDCSMRFWAYCGSFVVLGQEIPFAKFEYFSPMCLFYTVQFDSNQSYNWQFFFVVIVS